MSVFGSPHIDDFPVNFLRGLLATFIIEWIWSQGICTDQYPIKGSEKLQARSAQRSGKKKPLLFGGIAFLILIRCIGVM